MSGGRDNEAGDGAQVNGVAASVTGGRGNQARADWSSITGGLNCIVESTAGYGAISGGNAVIVTNALDWAAGSCFFCDQ